MPVMVKGSVTGETVSLAVRVRTEVGLGVSAVGVTDGGEKAGVKSVPRSEVLSETSEENSPCRETVTV